MLLPLIGLYLLGGFVCFIVLGIQYMRLAFLKQRRTPWSYFLGSGLVIFITSLGLGWYSNYTPEKNYSWEDGWSNGLWGLSWLIFMIGARSYFFNKKNAAKPADNMSIVEQDGVWPPPPNDKSVD